MDNLIRGAPLDIQGWWSLGMEVEVGKRLLFLDGKVAFFTLFYKCFFFTLSLVG